MKPMKEKVSLSLDGPMVEQIRQLAEGEDRSLSSYVNRILREYLEQQTKDAE